MAQLISQINSLVLVVTPPVDLLTGEYRDDLIGIKVWVSNTPDFEPPLFGELVYDGPGLVVTIPDLVAGQVYYVKYALISIIDESVYDVSDVAISGSPRSGLGVEISLSNPVDLVPATFNGTVTSFLGTGTTIEVFEGTESLVYDAVGTSAGTWSVTASADPEITLPPDFVEIVEGKAVTKNITGLSDDKATITFTAAGKSQDGTSFTRTIVQTFSKVKQGVSGTSGSSAALVYAYKRVQTAPTDNPGAVTYTFSSNTITSPTTLANSWQKTIPNGADPLYVTVATASSTADTDNIDASEWSTPVLLVQNGTDGLNTTTVFLYARNNSSVTAPTLSTAGTVTYTFSTRVLSGPIPSGWTTAIPAAASGTVIWVVQATASSITDTDTISNTEWSVPQVLAQKGDTGLAGITVTLSNESHTLPSTDTGVVLSYTGSGTTVQVYEGATLLSAVSSITANGQFTIGTPVVVPTGGITVGARSYSGTTATVAVHSAASTSTDLISINYPVSLRRSDGTTATINRIQTLTKAKSSKFAYLSTSSQVFVIEKDGDVTPSSITLTATGQNVVGSPVFTVTSGTATLTGTGSTRTLTYAGLITQSATIKLTWDGIEDFVTIGKVREGLDGERGSISIAVQPSSIPSASSSVFRYPNRQGNRAEWTSGTSASQPVFNETYAGYVDTYATQQLCLAIGATNSVENLKVGDTVTMTNGGTGSNLLSYTSDASDPNLSSLGVSYNTTDSIFEIDGKYVAYVRSTGVGPALIYSSSPPDSNGNQSWQYCKTGTTNMVEVSTSTGGFDHLHKVKNILFFYAVIPGISGRAFYSTNGVSWKPLHYPSVLSGGVLLVMPTSSGFILYGLHQTPTVVPKIFYTEDFNTLTEVSSNPFVSEPYYYAPTIRPESVCFIESSNVLLVGAQYTQDSGGAILRSTDSRGQTWTTISRSSLTIPVTAYYPNFIAHLNGTTVAAIVSSAGEPVLLKIITSTDDGLTWQDGVTLPETYGVLHHLVAYDDKFIASVASSASTSATRRIIYSTDGRNWTIMNTFSTFSRSNVRMVFSESEPNVLLTTRRISKDGATEFGIDRHFYNKTTSVTGTWDGSDWKSLSSLISGFNISSSTVPGTALIPGTINSSNISPLTLTADKISPNSIASLSTFLLTGSVEATLTAGTALTRINSTLIGSFTIVNDSNVAERLLVSAHGRSTASGSFSGQSQAFSVFDTAGATYYSSGYTRSDEDVKGFGFTTTVPAFTSVTFELRAAKTSSYTLTYNLTVNTVGVNN